MKYSKVKLDRYVESKMWLLSGGIYPVSVVELFHHVKDDKEFFKIFNLKYGNVEANRILRNYDKTIPILKESIERLRRKGLMSGPRRKFE